MAERARPVTASERQSGGTAGLSASVLAAFAFVSIRQMSDTEPAFRMVFYFSLFSALASATERSFGFVPMCIGAISGASTSVRL